MGRAEEMAVRQPVVPEGVVPRQVTEDPDLHRIAAMESTVWGQDWSAKFTGAA